MCARIASEPLCKESLLTPDRVKGGCTVSLKSGPSVDRAQNVSFFVNTINSEHHN